MIWISRIFGPFTFTFDLKNAALILSEILFFIKSSIEKNEASRYLIFNHYYFYLYDYHFVYYHKIFDYFHYFVLSVFHHLLVIVIFVFFYLFLSLMLLLSSIVFSLMILFFESSLWISISYVFFVVSKTFSCIKKFRLINRFCFCI